MKDNAGQLKDLPYDMEEKDLGIKFQSSLKFDCHIRIVVDKANKLIGLIKRTFSFMDKDLFIRLYKTLVRPHLDYGNSIWYPVTKKNMQSIENFQRRVTRIVPEFNILSYKERLQELNLPTLEYRRRRRDLIQMYKILHNIHDIDSSKFVSFKENIKRGYDLKLNKSRCLKSLSLNAFPARCIDDWNLLPNELVLQRKVEYFKKSTRHIVEA